jgi:probable HAF family extracellular repeat protein
MSRMRSSILIGVILVAGLNRVHGKEGTFVFSPIDFPGATLTNAQGINAGGDVVGFYNDAAGKTHGFIYSGGNFRSVDYPDATLTQLRGIGPSGDVVGTYQRQNESGAVPIHGFLLTRHGDFHPVNYPAHQNSASCPTARFWAVITTRTLWAPCTGWSCQVEGSMRLPNPRRCTTARHLTGV